MNVAMTKIVTKSAPILLLLVDNTINTSVLSTIVKDNKNDTTFHLYSPPIEIEDSASFLSFMSSTDPVVFASVSIHFNFILNSGCMNHIIWDCKFF